MKKQYVRTSSSTAKLSAIEGMYPTRTANHIMRSASRMEIEAFKARRKNKQFLKTFINEAVKNILEIIEINQQAALKLAEGKTSLAEEMERKGNLVFQQLSTKKKQVIIN